MTEAQEIKGEVESQLMDIQACSPETVRMEPKKDAYLCFWAAMRHVCSTLERGWQAKMAAHIGKDPGYISQIFHQKSKNPSIDVQEGIANFLGFDSLVDMLTAGSDLLDYGPYDQRVIKGFSSTVVHAFPGGDYTYRKEDSVAGKDSPVDEDFVQIPFRNGFAAGSPGGGTDLSKETNSYLSFQSQWIRHKGPSSQMAIIKVHGDSMSPAIPDGAVVLVDESRTSFARGKVFVVTHNNELKVKRLDIQDGLRVLLSDDGITPPEVVELGDQFKIEGRVLWTAHEVS